ncbi:unnamed protein product, partial [Urochloa humidicola]
LPPPHNQNIPPLSVSPSSPPGSSSPITSRSHPIPAPKYPRPPAQRRLRGDADQHEHETIYIEPSSSSPGSSGDGYIEMEEEVGKRFYPMVPVPHVPKINGEIPSVDEATMDHERLTERLKLYELTEHKVKGDGNCQFRALSDQLYQTPDHHEFVREQIIGQLKTNRDAYDGYVPMAYDDYLEKVARNGEWGDHVTLQAAADKYGVKIFVMTSFKDTCYIEIQPKVQKSNKVVLLSFWAEVHYNSIHPQNDAPRSQTTKKRSRWWPFSQHHHH